MLHFSNNLLYFVMQKLQMWYCGVRLVLISWWLHICSQPVLEFVFKYPQHKFVKMHSPSKSFSEDVTTPLTKYILHFHGQKIGENDVIHGNLHVHDRENSYTSWGFPMQSTEISKGSKISKQIFQFFHNWNINDRRCSNYIWVISKSIA